MRKTELNHLRDDLLSYCCDLRMLERDPSDRLAYLDARKRLHRILKRLDREGADLLPDVDDRQFVLERTKVSAESALPMFSKEAVPQYNHPQVARQAHGLHLREANWVFAMVDSIGSNPVRTSKKRRRLTKNEVVKREALAILYKTKNPEATEPACAKQAGLAVSTLHQRELWTEWSGKIEAAFQSGRLGDASASWDKRMNKYDFT